MPRKPQDVLDVYFRHSSLSMNCVDLARTGLFLANSGRLPWSDEQIVATNLYSINRKSAVRSVVSTFNTKYRVKHFATFESVARYYS